MMTHASTEQKTSLFESHLRQNAKMVPFAGWQMPLQYTKVLEEHHAVRSAAGLFDISHMGLVGVSCGDVEATRRFLDRLVPQDLSKLYPGKAVYTQFLNEKGGILDDIIIYMLPPLSAFSEMSEFLVICNAANVDADVAWMKSHADPGIVLQTFYEAFSLLALQGPRFMEVLAQKGIQTEALPKRFHITEVELDSVPVLLARTGYTGEDGVEIIVKNWQVQRLWDNLLEFGQPLGLRPVGLAARDTLRLEAAFPLHGHDISENDTPLEAGLGWSVKLQKATDFIGRAALEKQQKEGVARKFYCFKLKKKMIPRQHDRLFKEGREVGIVTSGSISPLLNEPIGMGYVEQGVVSGPGDILQIEIRGTAVDAEIVERPFYKAR